VSTSTFSDIAPAWERACREDAELAGLGSRASVRFAVQDTLLEFADGNGADEVFVPLAHPLTHESMAQIIGASRPHTSTVLRDLEGFGAVQRRSGRGLLVRPSRLRQIVGDGDFSVAKEQLPLSA